MIYLSQTWYMRQNSSDMISVYSHCSLVITGCWLQDWKGQLRSRTFCHRIDVKTFTFTLPLSFDIYHGHYLNMWKENIQVRGSNLHVTFFSSAPTGHRDPKISVPGPKFQCQDYIQGFSIIFIARCQSDTRGPKISVPRAPRGTGYFEPCRYGT